MRRYLKRVPLDLMHSPTVYDPTVCVDGRTGVAGDGGSSPRRSELDVVIDDKLAKCAATL